MKIKSLFLTLLAVIVCFAYPINACAETSNTAELRDIATVTSSVTKSGSSLICKTGATFSGDVTKIEVGQILQQKVAGLWIPTAQYQNTVYSYATTVKNTYNSYVSGRSYRLYSIVKAYKGSTLSGTYTIYSSTLVA